MTRLSRRDIVEKPDGKAAKATVEEVARLIDGGEVRPVVGAEFPPADALPAYRHKPVRGKVVLRVADAG